MSARRGGAGNPATTRARLAAQYGDAVSGAVDNGMLTTGLRTPQVSKVLIAARLLGLLQRGTVLAQKQFIAVLLEAAESVRGEEHNQVSGSLTAMAI